MIDLIASLHQQAPEYIITGVMLIVIFGVFKAMGIKVIHTEQR